MRTFVAPALGGPKEGTMLRQEYGIEQALVPTAGEYGPTWNRYRLVVHPDGSKVWQFEGCEVSAK